MTRIERTHTPDPERGALHAARYARYSEACSLLRPFFTA